MSPKKIIRWLLADSRKDALARRIIAKYNLPLYDPETGQKYEYRFRILTAPTFDEHTGKRVPIYSKWAVLIGPLIFYTIIPKRIYDRHGRPLELSLYTADP